MSATSCNQLAVLTSEPLREQQGGDEVAGQHHHEHQSDDVVGVHRPVFAGFVSCESSSADAMMRSHPRTYAMQRARSAATASRYATSAMSELSSWLGGSQRQTDLVGEGDR